MNVDNITVYALFSHMLRNLDSAGAVQVHPLAHEILRSHPRRFLRQRSAAQAQRSSQNDGSDFFDDVHFLRIPFFFYS